MVSKLKDYPRRSRGGASHVPAALHIDRAVRRAAPAGGGLAELGGPHARLRMVELRIKAVPGDHGHHPGRDALGLISWSDGALGLAGHFEALALLVIRGALAEGIAG